jgi:hypothetical protein
VTVQPRAAISFFAAADIVPVMRSSSLAAPSPPRALSTSASAFSKASVQRTQSTGSSSTARPSFVFATRARESERTAATGAFLWKRAASSALSAKKTASRSASASAAVAA